MSEANTYDGDDMKPTPVAPPQLPGPQGLDYRSNPSLNFQREDLHPSYDNPTAGEPASPPVDQTWKSYDEQLDATRYGGINSPEMQLDTFADPDPQNTKGFSPEIEKSLAWQREVDGSPPK